MGSIRPTALAATVAVIATCNALALAPIPSADNCTPIYPQVSAWRKCVYYCHSMESLGVTWLCCFILYPDVDVTSLLPAPRSARAQQPQRFRASRFPTSTPKLLRCENIRLGVLRWTSLIVCYHILQCPPPPTVLLRPVQRRYFDTEPSCRRTHWRCAAPRFPRRRRVLAGDIRRSDWYRSDGCINTADPGNGGIAAAIALLDVAWTNL